MTKEESLSFKDSRPDILQPLMQYRFRVLFGHEGMYELLTRLTQEVVYCNLDMNNKTLKMRLRQPTTVGFFHMLDVFIRHPNSIFLEPLNQGNALAISTLEFHECECTKHFADFNYGKNDILYHDLEFSYSRLEEFQPVNWEERKEKLNTEV